MEKPSRFEVPQTLAVFAGGAEPASAATQAQVLDEAWAQNTLLSPAFDEQTMRFFVAGILCNVPQVQRYVIDVYTTPDVTLVHPFGYVVGRDAYFHAFRCATRAVDYQVAVRDVVRGLNRAALSVNLRVRLRGLPGSARVVYPAVILFCFKTDTDGRTKVFQQQDHFTMYMLDTLGGVWAQHMLHAQIRPTLGKLLALQGRLGEALQLRLQGWLHSMRHHLGLQPTHTAEDLDTRRFLAAFEAPGAPGMPASPDQVLDVRMRRAVLTSFGASIFPPPPADQPDSWGALGAFGALTKTHRKHFFTRNGQVAFGAVGACLSLAAFAALTMLNGLLALLL